MNNTAMQHHHPEEEQEEEESFLPYPYTVFKPYSFIPDQYSQSIPLVVGEMDFYMHLGYPSLINWFEPIVTESSVHPLLKEKKKIIKETSKSTWRGLFLIKVQRPLKEEDENEEGVIRRVSKELECIWNVKIKVIENISQCDFLVILQKSHEYNQQAQTHSFEMNTFENQMPFVICKGPVESIGILHPQEKQIDLRMLYRFTLPTLYSLYAKLLHSYLAMFFSTWFPLSLSPHLLLIQVNDNHIHSPNRYILLIEEQIQKQKRKRQKLNDTEEDDDSGDDDDESIDENSE